MHHRPNGTPAPTTEILADERSSPVIWNLATLLVPLVIQVQESLRSSPFDQVHELELTADDVTTLEGSKVLRVFVPYLSDFDGTLHLWLEAQNDLSIRVEDLARALSFRETGPVESLAAYLRVQVEVGSELDIQILSRDTNDRVHARLHLVAAPETEQTIDAERRIGSLLAASQIIRPTEAGERVRSLITFVRSTPGTEFSELVARGMQFLGVLAREVGDLKASQAACQAALSHRVRTLPPGHVEISLSRMALATTTSQNGDHLGASALNREAVAQLERTLAIDDARLLTARMNLALTLFELGHSLESSRLLEAVVRTREATLPAGHPELLTAQSNLAAVVGELGDLPRARKIRGSILNAQESVQPKGHPDRLRAMVSLALSMKNMGDYHGARILEESALAGYREVYPRDHPSLLMAQQNLAISLKAMGEHATSIELLVQVVETMQLSLPADHPSLLRSQMALATTLSEAGESEKAAEIEEAVYLSLKKILPDGHPDLCKAELNLATNKFKTGDPEALEYARRAVDGYERLYSADQPTLLLARQNMGTMLLEQGDPQEAQALALTLASGMEKRLLSSLSLAPREVREVVDSESHRLGLLYAVNAATSGKLGTVVFEVQETLRLVAGEAKRAIHASIDPEVCALLERSIAIQTQLSNLGPRSSDHNDPDMLVSKLGGLIRERDGLESQASQLLAAHGVLSSPARVSAIASRLDASTALVTYRRVEQLDFDSSGRAVKGRDHIVAQSVHASGTLRLIDLGSADEIEDLVTRWRRTLGAPLRHRGVSVVNRPSSTSSETGAGEGLRQFIFDPIAATLDDKIRRILVCADDVIFLVPLDALPIEDRRLGDRFEFVNEVSTARLMTEGSFASLGEGCITIGDVHYGVAQNLSPDRMDPDGQVAAFAPLAETGDEIRSIATLSERHLGQTPLALTGTAASQDALFQHARGKRYVHLATHGWFGPTLIHDAVPTTRVLETVIRMAPMLLCGLALAGANQGRDSVGGLPGILTAEELCSVDLSGCELAVLSACETNVGIRRAGQGIQSLQAALYSAGARSSITSLWSVDDDATRQLMELFYERLWRDQQPKAKALWEAKRTMRESGAPPSHWAGWVLTGDPD